MTKIKSFKDLKAAKQQQDQESNEESKPQNEVATSEAPKEELSENKEENDPKPGNTDPQPKEESKEELKDGEDDPKPQKPGFKKGFLSKLKPNEAIAQKTGAAKPKTSSSAPSVKSDEFLKMYLEEMQDGQPHKIQDLLKKFNLPNTSGGREKLRKANRQIEESGAGHIETPTTDGGKAFKLVLVEK
jgi:hypothetical protein